MDRRTTRQLWLDALRGLATIFVLFGHQIPEIKTFFVFTSPIKIPLFFCISGFVFNDEGGNIREFFSKLFFRIVLPWLILSFLPRICISFFYGPMYLLESAQKIILGDMTWYFPCCIISLTMFFFQSKLLSDKRWTALSSTAIAGLGFAFAHWHILDFLFINTAMISQVFLLLGKEIRECYSKDRRIPNTGIVVLCVIYVLLGVLSERLFPGQTMDVHTNRYYNLLICFSMIMIGNVSLFGIFSRMHIKWKPLVYIGQNSMLFYLWGGYMSGFANQILKLVHLQSIHPIPYAVITTMIACIGCGVSSFLINRYVPFINGKRKTRG